MTQIETQATRITRLCGVENLAKWTGRTPTQVYRWGYAREKGGSGGSIPSIHHQAILDGAREANISLEPSDFFTQDAEPNTQARAS